MSVVDFTTGTIGGHVTVEAQQRHAVDGVVDFPGDQRSCDTHPPVAAGEHNPPAPAMMSLSPKSPTPVLALAPWADDNSPLLALFADILDDLERTRIANENRLRQLTRDEPDSDGEVRGFGLSIDMPQIAAVADLVDALGRLEHQATLNLQRAIRKHPLGPWVKATVGVGEKQGARLIAAVGDPYWNSLYDRPRTVSELWAYCGLHVLPAVQAPGDTQRGPGGGGEQGNPDQCPNGIHARTVGVAPTRARGQKANWSTAAKMRAYLVAESCIKQARSPYRAVYEEGRAKYIDALHQAECRRCGPSGKPAAIGTPISAGHQHARAMRLVMKQILKDLWRESRRLHGVPDAPA